MDKEWNIADHERVVGYGPALGTRSVPQHDLVVLLTRDERIALLRAARMVFVEGVENLDDYSAIKSAMEVLRNAQPSPSITAGRMKWCGLSGS